MSPATNPVLNANLLRGAEENELLPWSPSRCEEPAAAAGGGVVCSRCSRRIYDYLLSEEDMSVPLPWRFNWNLKQVSFSPAAPSASEQDGGVG